MKKRKKKGASARCELIYPGKSVAANPAHFATDLVETSRLSQTSAQGWANLLIHGDNETALRALLKLRKDGGLKNSDGSAGARLVYIDPPFSTNLEFKSRENIRAYEDKLTGAEFMEFIRRRLVLLQELLSSNGSIFVHLDWKKAHYVKVVMDEVFGEENFLNDIIWSYGGRGAKAVSAKFSRNHDIILWYRKESHIFNQVIVKKRIKKGASGFKADSDGRWFKTSPRGDYTDESIRTLEEQGRVYRTKTGKVRIKYFLEDDEEHIVEDKLVGDVWDDIPDGMHLSPSEKTGYPTQKPEALLQRIISASSNPGDMVLDCFCGSGTTLAAAEKLSRRWIGVDSGDLAIDTTQKRLLSIESSKDLHTPEKAYSKKARPFTLLKTATSTEALAKALPLHGAPAKKKLTASVPAQSSGTKEPG